MGASASSDGGGGAQDNWWECCGARAGKSGRTAVWLRGVLRAIGAGSRVRCAGLLPTSAVR